MIQLDSKQDSIYGLHSEQNRQTDTIGSLVSEDHQYDQTLLKHHHMSA